MCPCRYVPEDDALEVATGDTVVIKEHVIAVLCQILENSECPRNIGAAITEKNGFFDAFHTGAIAALTRKDRIERYQNSVLTRRARHHGEICSAHVVFRGRLVAMHLCKNRSRNGQDCLQNGSFCRKRSTAGSRPVLSRLALGSIRKLDRADPYLQTGRSVGIGYFLPSVTWPCPSCTSLPLNWVGALALRLGGAAFSPFFGIGPL